MEKVYSKTTRMDLHVQPRSRSGLTHVCYSDLPCNKNLKQHYTYGFGHQGESRNMDSATQCSKSALQPGAVLFWVVSLRPLSGGIHITI